MYILYFTEHFKYFDYYNIKYIFNCLQNFIDIGLKFSIICLEIYIFNIMLIAF